MSEGTAENRNGVIVKSYICREQDEVSPCDFSYVAGPHGCSDGYMGSFDLLCWQHFHRLITK